MQEVGTLLVFIWHSTSPKGEKNPDKISVAEAITF